MCALRICANHIGFVCEEAVVPWAESVTSHRRRDMSERLIISIAEYGWCSIRWGIISHEAINHDRAHFVYGQRQISIGSIRNGECLERWKASEIFPEKKIRMLFVWVFLARVRYLYLTWRCQHRRTESYWAEYDSKFSGIHLPDSWFNEWRQCKRRKSTFSYMTHYAHMHLPWNWSCL